MPSSIKKICNFFKKRKCARKIFLVFVTLSDLSKTSNRAVIYISYRMHERWKCSSEKLICTCDQCDSEFCALHLTALIKPNGCILLYCCACLYPNTILNGSRLKYSIMSSNKCKSINR